jgi:uncharacterized protein
VTGDEVRVAYTKYDGSLHWHQTMHRLGEDEHGIWLGAPAGRSARRGSEPPIIIEQPYVLLCPDGQWWTAVFNGEPQRVDIYCDISTPPRWPHDGEVTMVDLDLDVLRLRADQQVVLVDEDEFAEHRVRYGYPAEVIRAAEQAAARLQEAISGGVEPFVCAFRRWLDQVS